MNHLQNLSLRLLLALIVLTQFVGSASAVVTRSNNTTGFFDGSSGTREIIFSAGDFSGSSGTIQDLDISIAFAKSNDSSFVPEGTSIRSGMPFFDEIEFVLTSPDGTAVPLINFDSFLDGTDGFQGTLVFDQSAANPVNIDPTTITAGTYRPASDGGSLDSFNGLNPIGTWSLAITDDVSLDGLSFYNYEISLLTAGSIVVDPDNVGATDVIIDPSGAQTLLTNPVAIPLSVGDLAIGNTGNGHLQVNSGGLMDASNLYIGGNATTIGGTGVFRVEGTGSVTVQGTTKLWGSLDILRIDGGSFTTGSFDKCSGGSLQHLDGTLTIDGGTFNVGPGDFSVSELTGNPHLRLVNGVTETLNNVNIGKGADRRGVLEISGNSTHITTGFVTISGGTNSEGTLIVSQNAQLNPTSIRLGDSVSSGSSGGQGAMVIEDGATVSPTNIYLAYEPLNNSSITMNEGNLDVAFSMYIGYEGTGHMDVSNGSQVTVNNRMYLGNQTGSTGSLTIADSQVDVTDDLHIGGNFSNDRGEGTITLNSGAVTVGDITTLSGSDDTLTINGGTFTTGSLDNSNGGTLNHNDGTLTIDGGFLNIGSDTDYHIEGLGAGHAIVTLKNGATWDPNGSVTVARGNTGTLNIESGSDVDIPADLIIGRHNVGATGTVNVADTGSKISVGGLLQVGSFETGFLNVSQSATVEVDSDVYIGQWWSAADGTVTLSTGGRLTNQGEGVIAATTGSRGSVTVTDPNSAWTTNGLSIGRDSAGNGTLNVLNAGRVAVEGNFTVANANGSQGDVLVSGTGSQLNIGPVTGTGGLLIGVNGKGTVTVQSGAQVDAGLSLRLGHVDPNSEGTLTVDGPGSQVTLDPNSPFYNTGVGNSGTGTLNIINGGSLTNAEARIGNATGSNGTATVDGTDPNGNASTWTSSGNLSVGYSGDGSLSIANGGIVTNDWGYIGLSTGTTNSVTVDGAGSTWTNTGHLYVGQLGQGSLSVTNGGTVTSILGRVAGSSTASVGDVTIDGAGSVWNNTFSLAVGDSGIGTMTLTNGGSVTSDEGEIGSENSATGTVTVDGTDPNGNASTWTSSGNLSVGYQGLGTLTVSSGGLVSSNSAVIGRNSGSDGSQVTITGSGSRWENTFEIEVGQVSDAVLEILDGGVVASAQGEIAEDLASNSSVLIDGSGSMWEMTGSLFIGGGSTASGGSGTLNIENAGHVEVAGTTRLWSDDDSLTVDGGSLTTGSLTIDPNANFNHLDGAVTVEGGNFSNGTNDLVVSSASGSPVMRFANGSQWSQFLSPSSITLGESHGENGTLELDASQLPLIEGAITVGDAGDGTLSLTNGAQLFSIFPGPAFIGKQPGSSGQVIVDGTNSNFGLGMSSDIYLGGDTTGAGGVGTLTIQNGGTVEAASTTLWGSGDTLTIDGGTLRTHSWHNTGGGSFNFVSGTFDIASDDAYVGTTGTGSALGISFVVPASSTLEVTGGDFTVAADGTLSLATGATANTGNVTNHGAIQLTDATFDLSGDLINHGTITATDSTLDASDHTNIGTYDLTDVTVRGFFNNDNEVISQGLVRFQNTAIGSGDYSGNGIVIFDGEFRPGNVFEDPTIVDFAGGAEFLGSSSRLRLTIAGADNSDPLNPQYDALEVAGDVYVSGAELSLILDGYMPTAGDSFDLISAGNLLTGSIFSKGFFSSLTGDLDWQINYDFFAEKVTATVVTPYSADFDGDGDVDQDDLIDPVDGWQARYGVDLDGFDFLAWQREFGSGVSSLVTTSEAVPEPSSLLLLTLAIAMLFSRRRSI